MMIVGEINIVAFYNGSECLQGIPRFNVEQLFETRSGPKNKTKTVNCAMNRRDSGLKEQVLYRRYKQYF